MAIKAIINNTEKEIEQIKNSDEQDIDYVYSRIGDTEVEGEPPISIKSIGGELTDYRIYGNTANGESVGDLETTGEHAGEYKVPVTVEGKNLAKNNYAKSSTLFTVEEVNNFIHVSGTNNSGSTKAYVISKENVFPAGSYDIVNNSDTTIGYDYKDNNDALVYGTVSANSIKTFNFPAVVTRYLNIYKSVPNGESIDNHFQTMVVRHGTDASTYEPYHAPVTTPIYLPEEIKKVGEEAEYIDYGEQKQHRVRKNLLPNTATSQTINGVTFTVNDDGSITCNGTATGITYCDIHTDFNSSEYAGMKATFYSDTSFHDARTYTVRISNSISRVSLQDITQNNAQIVNNGHSLRLSIRIATGYTCDNLTFYPMIRKADIEDDTYEPYIENTEVDVTLPALSTIKGTNTLSVNTSIQPSNIYIKDNFDYKKVFTATRAIEDELPLNYRSIEDNDSTLSNYRIYGNTVGGESVGDLVESGEHAGEYNIPVTVEGKNLLPNTAASQTIDGVTFTVNSDRSVTCNGTANNIVLYEIYSFPRFSGECILSGCPMTGSQDTYRLQYTNLRNLSYKDYGTGVNIYQFDEIQYPTSKISIRIEEGYTCDNLTFYPMIRKADIEDDTYEPFHAPVTTPIYIPEQIKKVGDEAEYIDYGEQKQHRVRKNLLKITYASSGAATYDGVSISNNDGILTLNGTSNNGSFVNLATAIKLPIGNYILTGGSENQMIRFQKTSSGYGYDDTGAGRNCICPEEVTSGVCSLKLTANYTYNSVKVYPMIRKADITDDTYEPYIENTDVDVTLPALPTVTGTNVLSVGTEVQPSDMYIKGKIKKKPKIYYKIYYYSQDGQTALSTETVEEGHDCTYSTVPTKESDTDFDYTFTGWSTSTNSTTATAGATENIQQNTNLYAAFSKSFKTDTISDSWEEIIANCDNGTYASKYQIGDLKTIDVGTEGPVQMQIVAIDTDLLASDNTQTAPITWISKQLLNTSAAMNSTATNYLSDWTNCDMRTYLKNTILPMLPSVVQNNIKEVTKYTNQRTGSTTFTTISSTEDIWLPSYREISNNTSYCETSGVQYNSIFTNSASRVKSKVGNSADYWWTRSASGYSNSDYSYCFAYVYSDGYAHYTGRYCTGSSGVAMGFCT